MRSGIGMCHEWGIGILLIPKWQNVNDIPMFIIKTLFINSLTWLKGIPVTTPILKSKGWIFNMKMLLAKIPWLHWFKISVEPAVTQNCVPLLHTHTHIKLDGAKTEYVVPSLKNKSEISSMHFFRKTLAIFFLQTFLPSPPSSFWL